MTQSYARSRPTTMDRVDKTSSPVRLGVALSNIPTPISSCSPTSPKQHRKAPPLYFEPQWQQPHPVLQPPLSAEPGPGRGTRMFAGPGAPSPRIGLISPSSPCGAPRLNNDHEKNHKEASDNGMHGSATEKHLSFDEEYVPEELRKHISNGSVLEEDPIVGEFGRTYHRFKAGRYLLPNDGVEQDRLDLQYAGWNVLMGDRKFLAPIPQKPSPRRVLDIGTGTGIWAIDFAEAHPESIVIGTDLSRIQPFNAAPPKCSFLLDDAEADWAWSEHEKFDYVHLGMVSTCFDNHLKVMRDAYTHMNPGAWIEYRDISIGELHSADGSSVQGTAFQELMNRMVSGNMKALNRNIKVVPRYAGWLREAGFQDVVTRQIGWPIGRWPKDRRDKKAGAFMQANIIDGGLLSAYRPLIASGLSRQGSLHLIDRCKKEVLDRRNYFYLDAYVVYGRKP